MNEKTVSLGRETERLPKWEKRLLAGIATIAVGAGGVVAVAEHGTSSSQEQALAHKYYNGTIYNYDDPTDILDDSDFVVLDRYGLHYPNDVYALSSEKLAELKDEFREQYDGKDPEYNLEWFAGLVDPTELDEGRRIWDVDPGANMPKLCLSAITGTMQTSEGSLAYVAGLRKELNEDLGEYYDTVDGSAKKVLGKKLSNVCTQLIVVDAVETER